MLTKVLKDNLNLLIKTIVRIYDKVFNWIISDLFYRNIIFVI